jgi:hypothetical protein
MSVSGCPLGIFYDVLKMNHQQSNFELPWQRMPVPRWLIPGDGDGDSIRSGLSGSGMSEMSQATGGNGMDESRRPSRRSKRLRQMARDGDGLEAVAESDGSSHRVHIAGEGAGGIVDDDTVDAHMAGDGAARIMNGDVVDAPIAGENAAGIDDVVDAPMAGENAAGIDDRVDVHMAGEGAAGIINGDVVDAPMAGEDAASIEDNVHMVGESTAGIMNGDVVVAPMDGEDAAGIMNGDAVIMNGDAVNSLASSGNDEARALDVGTGLLSETSSVRISNIFGSGADSMASIGRMLMAECNTAKNQLDDDGDEDEGGEEETVSSQLKKGADSVFAPQRKVLFLMPEVDGEECRRLRISPTCNMLVVFFDWCVQTNLNSTIVRRDGNTFVFGDEMFLVAVQAARTYLMKERRIHFDLKASNNKSMMKKFSVEISAVLKNFHFMGTG